ncbi:MAG: hypothetical protein D6690_12205 [Nitrospirae bacterium]|nr:MAG: hypothetical protein D6690_12205 [Nitrospirota bacterium]
MQGRQSTIWVNHQQLTVTCTLQRTRRNGESVCRNVLPRRLSEKRYVARATLYLVLSLIGLATTGCLGRWLHPQDLPGLDELARQSLLQGQSRIPLAVVLGVKEKVRLRSGYGVKLVRGRREQLPDGQLCWYDGQRLELLIKGKQIPFERHETAYYTLLIHLLESRGTQQEYRFSINGEPYPMRKEGRGWYKARIWLSKGRQGIDSYYPATWTFSIESTQGVCLTVALLIGPGIGVSQPSL